MLLLIVPWVLTDWWIGVLIVNPFFGWALLFRVAVMVPHTFMGPIHATVGMELHNLSASGGDLADPQSQGTRTGERFIQVMQLFR